MQLAQQPVDLLGRCLRLVRLLGELGQLATAFRLAHDLADPDAAEAAIRDLAELRLLCFDALGRKP